MTSLYPHRDDARAGIVRACRRLWERGLIAGPDGNVSVRVGDDRVLVTPSGASKVDVTEDGLVEVALDGRALGPGRASSELRMHLAIYRGRPDVAAVVHAHPPTATAFGVAREPIPDGVLPEVICQMGSVAMLPYATPGTEAAAEAFVPYLSRHDAFVMANHGATTVGPTLELALQRMESLEHAARIILAARLLGRVTPLSDDDLAALRRPAAAPPDTTPDGRPSDTMRTRWPRT